MRLIRTVLFFGVFLLSSSKVSVAACLPAFVKLIQDPVQVSNVFVRPSELRDLDFVQQLFSDPKVRELFAFNGELDPKSELEWSQEGMVSGEGAYLIIADQDSQEPVGLVVFWLVEPSELGRTDRRRYARIGIALTPGARGRWLNVRVMRSLKGFLLEDLEIDHLIARVEKVNRASFVPAVRGGFVEFPVPSDPDRYYFAYPGLLP